jgi:hypothetical protein
MESSSNSSASGIFNLKKLKLIQRKGKPNVFADKIKGNITKYLFDFFYYRELSEIGSINIFLHNCFIEYEISTWPIEMRNLIDIFHLDTKNLKEEVDTSLLESIKKQRLYPMKDFKENYVKIDKEGINLISLVYYDPNMKEQLNKLNNNIQIKKPFNFEALEMMELDDDIDGIIPSILKTPWRVVHTKYSYIPGNIIFLEEKSPLDFGFSFHHVIKGNYKFYLHQNITNMKNAKLKMQIYINNIVVFEKNDFPSKSILKQFNEDNKIILDSDGENDTDDDDIKLKDTYICDINSYMFDSVKDNLKNSTDSDISTESNNSIKNCNIIKDYTIRIRFTNQHLFWRAGWYLDGGRLVRSVYKI